MNYNKVKPGDIVPCAYCGGEFTAVHYSQYYCSDECRKRRNREKHELYYKERRKKQGHKTKDQKGLCEYCGEEFEYLNNTLEKYCSTTCKSRANRKAPKRKAPKEQKYCVVCGEPLIGIQRYYCSIRCRNKNNTKYMDPQVKKYKKKCRCCGSVFESHSNRSYYCSTECFRKAKERKSLYRSIPYAVYIIGYSINDVSYAIKIGKTTGKSMCHRLDSLQTGNPFLLKDYCVKSFDTEQEAIEFETMLHDSTIQYRTEADNEWRIVDIDTLIELYSFNECTYVVD